MAKKVFTSAGEKLAEFLIQSDEIKISDQNLSSIISKINNNEPSLYEYIIDLDKMSTEEIFKFFSEQIRLYLNNLNISTGEKEIHFLDITQKMYNEFEYQKISSEAQFKAINNFLSTKLADIIKTIGVLNRSYQVADIGLNRSLANLVYKPLDYFIGGTDDKSRIYYRFSGSKLLVSNGIKDSQQFHEVFRVETLAGSTQTSGDPAIPTLGSTIYFGLDDIFENIELSKPTKVKGDLTLEDGELMGIALSSRYGDIAEYYSSDKEYSPGTLVMVDQDSNNQVTINDGSCAYIGVVSYKPGFILNKDLLINDRENDKIVDFIEDQQHLENSKNVIPIVLAGKVPVKVHSLPDALGRINKGDILFPSNQIIGAAVAVPYKVSYQFEIDNKIKPIGVTLDSSYPLLITNENAHLDINIIYSKIN